MERTDYVLGVMAAAPRPLSPVQVQKLFFILDEKAGPQLGGPHFTFEPYHYGPFDAAVYRELEALRQRGLLVEERTSSTRLFSVSASGVHAGLATFSQLASGAQDYVRKLIDWVASQSFSQLVAAVYKEWPSMKVNSVFRD